MTCSNKYKKSTLRAYTDTTQVIAPNGLIPFANYKNTGCSINLNGETSVKLNKPGLYQITFNGYVVESTATGDIIVQLMSNGSKVNGAVAAANSSVTTDLENLSFSTIIDVAPSCNCVDNDVVLTVLNEGVAASFGNVNLTVVKLC